MRAVAEEQMAKSGDSIFRVTSVRVEGAEWFTTAKLLAEVRRESLSKLAAARFDATHRREHRRRVMKEGVRYPETHLTPQHNVVNSLAEGFYRRVGVESIVRGLDLRESTVGEQDVKTMSFVMSWITLLLWRVVGSPFLHHGNFDMAICSRSNANWHDAIPKLSNSSSLMECSLWRAISPVCPRL